LYIIASEFSTSFTLLRARYLYVTPSNQTYQYVETHKREKRQPLHRVPLHQWHGVRGEICLSGVVQHLRTANLGM
jgi:hypothetical protein